MLNSIKTFFFILLLVCSEGLFAQKNIIKVNPLSPLLNVVNFSYERVISLSKSLQFTAFYYYRTPFLGHQISYINSGYSLAVDYRLYLNKKAPQGIYLAPFIRAKYAISINADGEGYEVTKGGTPLGERTEAFILGEGILLGSQFVLKMVTIDFFAGPYYDTVFKTKGNYYAPTNLLTEANQFIGIGLRAGINVGFAF